MQDLYRISCPRFVYLLRNLNQSETSFHDKTPDLATKLIIYLQQDK